MKNKIFIIVCFILSSLTLLFTLSLSFNETKKQEQSSENDFIKWVDFNVPMGAMQKAINIDIKTRNENHQSFIETLAYLGTKYGNNWKKYKSSDMDKFIKDKKNGRTIEILTTGMKHYNYYYEIYNAVLGQMVGEYEIEQIDENNNSYMDKRYGIKNYSPIAYGYSFSDFDDFGNSRSFGYKRKHLGHDMMGNIGTPIIAVESGVIEEIGWNQYGGWRIGIRSFDTKRYYYYAHLKKDTPFKTGLQKGDKVAAGDVIGYLGMTGYSDTENVNGMKVPHLHFGMQLIFDESQKEGNNEIWIDVYQIVKLLEKHKSPVVKDGEGYKRKYKFQEEILNSN